MMTLKNPVQSCKKTEPDFFQFNEYDLFATVIAGYEKPFGSRV